MTPASIAAYLAAAAYLASAVFWWRAARRAIPVPKSGWGAIPNVAEISVANSRTGLDNTIAAGLAGFASALSGLALILA